MAGMRSAYPEAWVTGGSSGIGAAFARALAARGTRRLTLVARRRARLEALAAELRVGYGVEAVLSVCDLADANQTGSLAAELAARPPDLLVDNAGAGLYGAFATLPIGPQLALIDLNVRALVELSHAYVRAALQRQSGSLLLVASVAAWVPLPYEAVYAATKSFVLHFGEALHEELRGSPVRLCTLCPGVTATEFGRAAGWPGWIALPRRASPEVVAATGLAALARGAPVSIHGWGNRFASGVGRVAPRRLLLRGVGRWMRRGLTERSAT